MFLTKKKTFYFFVKIIFYYQLGPGVSLWGLGLGSTAHIQLNMERKVSMEINKKNQQKTGKRYAKRIEAKNREELWYTYTRLGEETDQNN